MKKINKHIVMICMLAAGVPALAQKVTLKKDEFRIDGTAIAKIDEKRSSNIVNKNFTILNMKDEPLITMEIRTLVNPLGFNNPTWHEVTFVPLNKTVTHAIPEGLFGVRKALMEEFADTDVLTKDGLNEAGVAKYMERHSLDLAYRGKVVVDSIGGLIKRSSFIKQRASGKIRVDENTITEKNEPIGTWSKYGDWSNGDGRYIISNTEGGIVGVVTRTKGFGDEVEVIMFINGERKNFSKDGTGITVNDKDKTVIEKFVRFAIDKKNM